MPDGGDDEYRVVLDESGLNWQGIAERDLGSTADALADLLSEVGTGRDVAFLSSAYEVICRDGRAFADVLYGPAPIPRDARVRLQTLLDRCQCITPTEPDPPTAIHLDGVQWASPSRGLMHAVGRAVAGRAMACLTLPFRNYPSGWVEVQHGEHRVEVNIIGSLDEVPDFWRGVMVRETWAFDEVLARREAAFPALLFAPDLDVRKFRGDYALVCRWLIGLLGAISDHFAATLRIHQGDRNKVIGHFGSLGFDISPESPNTHANSAAWRQRRITFDGVTYVCEWHGKREPTVDRVHFSLPIPQRGDRVLIGVFAGHLST